jgi:hypothetical protein
MMMRLKVLIAVHLFVGMCPLATYLVPPDIRFLRLLWVPASVSFAQLMLLSF